MDQSCQALSNTINKLRKKQKILKMISEESLQRGRKGLGELQKKFRRNSSAKYSVAKEATVHKVHCSNI